MVGSPGQTLSSEASPRGCCGPRAMVPLPPEQLTQFVSLHRGVTWKIFVSRPGGKAVCKLSQALLLCLRSVASFSGAPVSSLIFAAGSWKLPETPARQVTREVVGAAQEIEGRSPQWALQAPWWGTIH